MSCLLTLIYMRCYKLKHNRVCLSNYSVPKHVQDKSYTVKQFMQPGRTTRPSSHPGERKNTRQQWRSRLLFMRFWFNTHNSWSFSYTPTLSYTFDTIVHLRHYRTLRHSPSFIFNTLIIFLRHSFALGHYRTPLTLSIVHLEYTHHIPRTLFHA